MITAKQLSEAYISGANNIENNRQKVDALNVFPVPDGDTGTNMSMTMGAAREELLHNSYTTVGDVAGKAASALLRAPAAIPALSPRFCSAALARG